VIARLGSKQDISSLKSLAISDFSRTPSVVPEQWGALSLLIRAEREGLGSAWRWIKRAHPMVQGLIVEILPDSYFNPSGRVKNLLLQQDMLSTITIPGRLISRNLTHLSYGLKSSDLSEHLAISLRATGVITTKAVTQDQIAQILTSRFGVGDIRVWRYLLGKEYIFARRILVRANSLYESHRSEWLQHQDSFNDLVFRHFIGFLRKKSLPGARKTVDKNGKLINFGSLLQRNQQLTLVHATLSDPFRDCHERRNSLPGSHPYNYKGKARNTYLSFNERQRISTNLRGAFDYLLAYVAGNK
jgi:hypothetical protein